MCPEIVCDYDPSWPRAFEAERRLLEARLGSAIEGIEHIGSTAVPGLAAKPLTDIMVAVSDEQVQGCVDALVELRYRRHAEGDFPGRVFLRRLDSHGRATHHLSLTEAGSAYWRDQLAFRNTLRADAELAARYAELKRALAEEHGRGLAYTKGKTAFIREALAGVGHQAGSGWASGPSEGLA